MGIRDDELDGGLFEAFKPPRDESALEAIARLHGAGASLLLRDAGDDASPVLLRRAVDGVEDDPRYQVLGEVARGGIGIVYKGRDKDLNREVALKVLRPEYADRDDVIQRFIEEAQVGGQLQHPGIVPVYGLGLQKDGRPSFAMKLIKGQTLAELLSNNPRGVDLLTVYEQVAQTIAYAHSRGVIHRDLKPANVMVGAFGEVQVVDWGFAKVLGQEDLAPRPDRTVIATVRSGEEGSQSIAGSIMGTPAYMPPEQALGHIAELDEASDVFALGAILCEILTGKPPYTGKQKDQLVAASQCLLQPAFERLDAAEADDELKQVVRDCLQPLGADRPRNARVLADRLATHFAQAEERARQAELDAVASESNAAREQHRKRRTLVLATAALLLVAVGAGGFLWSWLDRTAREERARPLVAAALRDAKSREGERDWTAAVAAARKAVDIAKSEAVPDAGATDLLGRLELATAAAADEAQQNDADGALLDALENARALDTDHYSDEAIEAAYAGAVRRRWASGEVDAGRLKESGHEVAFGAAFDAWVQLRRSNDQDWQVVDAWARAIDPGNNALRDAIAARDGDALERLLAEQDLEQLPPGRIASVASALGRAKRKKAALALLRRAHRVHPGDFWINYQLGFLSWQMGQDDLAHRHLAAALALRPHNIETRHRLGIVLEENDDHEGALAIWRDALEARPDWTHGRSHVAKALARLGKHDAALAESRTVMERSPDTLSSHLFHSEVQALCGDEDGARTTLQDAVERFPKSAMALRRLGAFLTNHDNEEAVRCLRKALEIAPDDESTLQNLGVALRNLRDFKGAIEADRKAIALLSEGETNPQFLAMCHGGLGHSLLELGDFKEAEQELGKAIALDPANANYHAQLGYARSWQRNLRGAVAAFREAARLEPENWLWWRDLWNGHTNLGDFERGLEALRRAAELNPVLRAFIATYLCDQLCRWDDAIAEFRRLRQANPTDAYAHSNTGVAFRGKRDYAQAILWHRKGIALAPEDPVLWMALGNTLERSGDLNGALDAYRKAKELGRSHPQLARLEKFLAWRAAGEPDDLSPPDRAAMARVLEFTGRHDMSLRFFRQAFEQSPSLQRQHMYPAMRVAVLAGAREQALAWMRYFLEVQAETAAVAPGGAMGNLLSTLHSRDFAPVRDAPDLPEEWKAFWRDLEALRAHIVAEARK